MITSAKRLIHNEASAETSGDTLDEYESYEAQKRVVRYVPSGSGSVATLHDADTKLRMRGLTRSKLKCSLTEVLKRGNSYACCDLTRGICDRLKPLHIFERTQTWRL